MRRTMFVGSWKANKSLAEAKEFFKEFTGHASRFMHETVLCPAYVHMETAMGAMPSTVKLGAQDCSQFGNGPHTGEISASMLSGFGVKYCIVGHVERRAAGETDEDINKKVKQCLAAGISPIICVGDTLAEYDNNMTRVVLEKQMRDCLVGVTAFDKLVFCYMPIWSIGTGFYASGEYANIIGDFIRKTLQKLTGNPMSANIPILFGGQITATNVREYLECPECDGVMFAVAALKPMDFASIANTKFAVKKFAN